MHVTNLEPNVLFGERPRRIVDNVFEALWQLVGVVAPLAQSVQAYLQTRSKFLLLLVNYAKAKVDFVGLFKIGIHAHHLRKGFLCMLERAVAIVQDAYSVPKLGLLFGVRQVGDGAQQDIPWDPSSDTEPAGRPSKLAGGRPSSDSNDLGIVSWRRHWGGARVGYQDCSRLRRCWRRFL